MSNCKILQQRKKKQKCLNLAPKMPYLGIFELKLKNRTIAIFEISTNSLIGSFVKKQKCLNLGPKIPYLGIFELQFKKNILIF